MLKGIKDTLLAELKEIFLPYFSDYSNNIIAVPAIDAAELTLKMIRRWSKEANSVKAAGAANILLMEKSQTLCAKIDTAKEELPISQSCLFWIQLMETNKP